jgi:thymidylate synthase
MHRFKTAQEAFEFYYYEIKRVGLTKPDSKFLNNVGFYIDEPGNNEISTPYRKWSLRYAAREWKWYLSKNRKVTELKKFAPIWDKMHNGNDIVNSNYGYQWSRNGQLLRVAEMLIKDQNTRRAVLTIYDGKEISEYAKDTPCTLNITFNIYDNKLNMSVMMRSNDLWFGFCNDQYCFSMLQAEVARLIGLVPGWYYDLHLYNEQLKK